MIYVSKNGAILSFAWYTVPSDNIEDSTSWMFLLLPSLLKIWIEAKRGNLAYYSLEEKTAHLRKFPTWGPTWGGSSSWWGLYVSWFFSENNFNVGTRNISQAHRKKVGEQSLGFGHFTKQNSPQEEGWGSFKSLHFAHEKMPKIRCPPTRLKDLEQMCTFLVPLLQMWGHERTLWDFLGRKERRRGVKAFGVICVTWKINEC